MVILSKNSVFSLLFLVSSFVVTSLLLFLLECEFLGLLFIIIYVGAIAILFIFSIMMLESKLKNLTKNSLKYLPIGFIFGLFFIIPCIKEISFYYGENWAFNSSYINLYQNWYELIDANYEVEIYGQVLYSYFIIPFLVAGLILLLVLISVVYLVNLFEKHQSLKQSVFKQLAWNSKFLLKKNSNG